MTEPTDNSELTDRLFAELESAADEALAARLAADPELTGELAELEGALGQLQEGLQPLPETPRELLPEQRDAVLDLAAQLDREAAVPVAGVTDDAGGGTTTSASTASAAPTLTLWSRIPVAMKMAASLAICAGLAWLVVELGAPDPVTSGSTVAMHEEAEDPPDEPTTATAAEKAKLKNNADGFADVSAEMLSEDEGLEALETTTSSDLPRKQAQEMRSMQSRMAKEAPADSEMKRRNDHVGGGGMGDGASMAPEALAQTAKPDAEEQADDQMDVLADRDMGEAVAAAELMVGNDRRERGKDMKPTPMASVAPSVAALKGENVQEKKQAPVLADARVRVVGGRKMDAAIAAPAAAAKAENFAADRHVGRLAVEGDVAGAMAPPPAGAAPAAPARPAPRANRPARQTADAAPMPAEAEAMVTDTVDAADAMADDDDAAVGAVRATAPVAQRLPGKVTVDLRNATVREVLVAISAQARVRVRLEGERIIFIPHAFNITRSQAIAPDASLLRRLDSVRLPQIRLQNADINDALNRLISLSREQDPDGVGIPSPLVMLPDPSGQAVAYLPYRTAPLEALATSDSATVAVAGSDVTFTIGAVPVRVPNGAAAAMEVDTVEAIEAETEPTQD